jgi:DNA-nicking Smr family endonuclease
MDFGSILDEWNKRPAKSGTKNTPAGNAASTSALAGTSAVAAGKATGNAAGNAAGTSAAGSAVSVDSAASGKAAAGGRAASKAAGLDGRPGPGPAVGPGPAKDFGSILDDWDKRAAMPDPKKAPAVAGGGGAAGTAAAGTAAAGSAAAARPVGADAGANARKVDPLSAWLRIHGVQDKDSLVQDEELSREERRRRLIEKRPDAVVDLHGLTRDEAWERLGNFFSDARRRGLEKVLIVHGKGNHSQGEAILKRTTREFIERCAYAGSHGHASSTSGGTGATWVIVKQGEDAYRGR